MKKSRVLLVIMAVIAVAAGGFLGLRRWQAYQEQAAIAEELRYKQTLEHLDLSGKPIGDLQELREYTGLKTLDLRDTGLTGEQYDRLKSWLPEARILWDIPFQGAVFSMDTQELAITALTEADLQDLARFPELKRVDASRCGDYARLTQLRRQLPGLEVSYSITAAGESYPWDSRSLVLPGAGAESLAQVLPFFTELETVELTEPLAPAEQVLALTEACPEVEFSWKLELAGMEVDRNTQTLDLTGIPMTVEEMDAALPYLTGLTYVDMTDCGISNEEMDALNRRYGDIKIVWTVAIGPYIRLRTDDTWFMPGKWPIEVHTADVYNLRYCTDMICVDLGHMPVKNCEWARYMPKLKYLLLADTDIVDISPLAGLQELVYLELFLTAVVDYSPLVECPALEDLNIHYTYGDPEPIMQMSWLNNLWWSNYRLTPQLRQELAEKLPNTHFEFDSYGSTENGWRELENYYAQRDLMGVPYMK